MKTLKKITAVMMALLMLLATFSIAFTSSAAGKKVTKVALSKTSLSLYTTQTYTLKATVSPSNASNKKVRWTSSNTLVASVSSSGTITAKRKGTATITCTAQDGSNKKATCKVTVTKKVNVSSVKLSATSVTISKGSTKRLTATVSPSNASVTGVKWKSSNTKVATVSSSGKISAVGYGTATITCTSKDDSDKKATCKVTVKRPVTGVKLNKTSLELYTTQTATLKATVSPSNATVKTVKWKSSNTSIATVSSSGVVTAKKAGKVTITCTASDNSKKKATCSVTVTKKVNVNSIKLSATSASITKGYTKTLKATVSPSNASVPGVKWTSSNTKVATVSSKGKVTAVSVGTATITCTSTDNSKIKATCKITVKPIKVSAIKLNKTSALIYPGKSVTLTATASPENAANKAVTWKSSNTKVATVSSNGVVTGVKSGSVTITCTAKDGSGKKATCKITVGVPVTGLVISTDEIGPNAWYVGKTSKLSVTVAPSNATNKGITWTSSKPNCVSVDSEGNVKVIKQNTYKILGIERVDDDQNVTITATSKYDSSIKATYKLTIVKDKVVVTGVSIATTNSTGLWLVGHEYDVIASVVPEGASNPKVKFMSSDKSVATVSSNGSVTILKAGSATIKAISVENNQIMSSLQIETIEPTLSIKSTEPQNGYFAVGEYTFLSYDSNLGASSVNKLGGLKYEVDDPDVALVTQTEGYPYATVKFLKAGTLKFRVRTVNEDIVSDWVTVEVRDIKVKNDFFENVKLGDTINIDAYIYNGKNKVTDSSIDLLYTSPYSELKVSDDGKTVKIEKELSGEGAYIEVTTSDGRLTRKIYFIPGEYNIPESKNDRLDLMKKFSTDMYTEDFLASYSRRVNFKNLASDKNNSSTEILFDWGLFKDLDLSGLMSAMGGSGNTGDVDDDLDSLDFIETLFGENIVENSAAVTKDSCPKPITVSADAVDKITVDDNGATYSIKMVLKDQAKMLPDAVATSDYAKSMPVIDKAYLDNYIKSFSHIDGLTDGDESIEISSVSYGTVNQTYTDGYVEYTVDKFTNKVTKSVYHYDSKVDTKNAKLNLKATVADIDIVMKINIKAAFTMNVDNTLVLGDIIY